MTDDPPLPSPEGAHAGPSARRSLRDWAALLLGGRAAGGRLLWVRSRLLLAFFGISAFALAAALAAFYSLLQVGQSVDRITERRMPIALASLKLSRQAEHLVATVPALLAVTSEAEHAALSESIMVELDDLQGLLAELEGSELEPAALEPIQPAVDWLSLNLINLDTAVANALAHAELNRELLAEVAERYAELERLIEPRVQALAARDAGLRATVGADRSAALAELTDATTLRARLREIQLLALAASNTMLQTESVEDPGTLAALRDSAAQALERMEALAAGIEPDLGPQLVAGATGLRGFMRGGSNVFRARELQLAGCRTPATCSPAAPPSPGC
jgi:adenylate cyclase